MNENMKTINYRLGNLELRFGSNLEIVQWGNTHCWTIAYWEENKDGYPFLRFVSNRPLAEDVSWDDFKLLISTGYDYLSNKKI